MSQSVSSSIATRMPSISSPASSASSELATATSTKEKRKRKSTESSDQPRKKKANRACFHCQKAHLTCDDSRPCQRCVKRGLQDNCTDGIRKKAKYLLDEEELEELKKSQDPKKKSGQKDMASSTPATASYPSIPPPPAPQRVDSSSSAYSGSVPGTSSQPALTFPYPSGSQDLPFLSLSPNPGMQGDGGLGNFGSEALNMEYSILSQILGNPSESHSSPWLDSPSTPFLTYGYQTNGQNHAQQPQPPPQPARPQQQFAGELSSQVVWPSSSPPEEIVPVSQNPPDLLQLHPLAPRWPLNTQPKSPPINPAWPAVAGGHQPKDGPSNLGMLQTPSPVPSFRSASTSSYPAQGNADGFAPSVHPHSVQPLHGNGYDSPGGFPMVGLNAAEPSELRKIMLTVTTPYDYTQGYHFLMRFLKERFEKNDILRIVRALAIFRPSLIALQMPLSLDDEIFVEQCFQRSLVELHKLMSFTGTPTVVWRRTGEICAVAEEFLLLTDRKREELLPPQNLRSGSPPKRKYIYELFHPVSTVEYWENFAQHAFENSTHSVSSHCALLKPDGTPVLCSFCFTIRRDMFDLPSLIVGQWLPLL